MKRDNRVVYFDFDVIISWNAFNLMNNSFHSFTYQRYMMYSYCEHQHVKYTRCVAKAQRTVGAFMDTRSSESWRIDEFSHQESNMDWSRPDELIWIQLQSEDFLCWMWTEPEDFFYKLYTFFQRLSELFKVRNIFLLFWFCLSEAGLTSVICT